MSTTKNTTGPADVDAYIAAQPEAARKTLIAMRTQVKAAAPDATEVISYGIPTFRLDKALVAIGAAKAHCSFYIMSTAVTEAHREDLKGYKTGKGSINISFGEMLPDELVTKLVKARVKENSAG